MYWEKKKKKAFKHFLAKYSHIFKKSCLSQTLLWEDSVVFFRKAKNNLIPTKVHVVHYELVQVCITQCMETIENKVIQN